MEKLVLQLMETKQTNGAFNFSAFLRFDSSLSKQAHQAWTCTPRDENCEPTDSPVDAQQSEDDKDDPGDTGTETLINTVLFIGVCLFMICQSMVSQVETRVLTHCKSSQDLVWLCYT